MTIKQTTDKQTINWPTILFETDYFPFEKKTCLSQVRITQDPCPPDHIPYLQAKLRIYLFYETRER